MLLNILLFIYVRLLTPGNGTVFTVPDENAKINVSGSVQGAGIWVANVSLSEGERESVIDDAIFSVTWQTLFVHVTEPDANTHTATWTIPEEILKAENPSPVGVTIPVKHSATVNVGVGNYASSWNSLQNPSVTVTQDGGTGFEEIEWTIDVVTPPEGKRSDWEVKVKVSEPSTLLGLFTLGSLALLTKKTKYRNR